ncbi:MAG TPA: alkaline phosphatase family protein [Vicinamibacteria bacterium]|nr:alkaline phosphatase family protein [Vicinamibacteria bacterium]
MKSWSFPGRLALLAAAVAVLAALPQLECRTAPPGGKPLRRTRQRVFVMGFDGMDPTLARRWMDEGKLPNLKALAEGGTFARLKSTQPSESPTAWSSFATGVNPGKHNIYDFLIRNLDTYFPDLSLPTNPSQRARFLFGLFETARPAFTFTRGGTSFWKTASADGIETVVLTVPVTFPPEELAHGEVLGGLPTPDVRDSMGTFYYWATDLSSYEEGNSELNGYLKRLLFDGGTAQTVLRGPQSPVLWQEEAALKEKKKQGALSDKEQARLDELATGKDVNLPMAVRWTEGSGRVEIEIQGQKLVLKAGEWSPWVPLSFRITPFARVHGMTQFFVRQADRELRLFGSPVNLDPRDPPIRISTPDSFSKDLADKVGLYRTLGWAESADKPLNEGRLDEAEFLYDSDRAMDDREKVILENLKRDDWDLMVAAIETTDRISHMMWRLTDPRHPMYDRALAEKYGDSIEKIYRRADDFVGQLRARLPKDALFMVMSDHGFHSFRREVNLNTWLAQNGYLVLQGQGQDQPLAELFGRGKFFQDVDWSRTRAYAVGLGQIYFNLRGREGRGIVSPGEEYRKLQDEIRQKLVTLTDPETGERVFSDIYRRDDIYKGEYVRMAPDLQVGFLDGYRVGWQDTMGGIRRSVVENNNKKWSGDHCATATEISHGVFFCNRRIATAEPSIMDLAPSVLKVLGAPIPADYDGQPLW